MVTKSRLWCTNEHHLAVVVRLIEEAKIPPSELDQHHEVGCLHTPHKQLIQDICVATHKQADVFADKLDTLMETYKEVKEQLKGRSYIQRQDQRREQDKTQDE